MLVWHIYYIFEVQQQHLNLNTISFLVFLVQDKWNTKITVIRVPLTSDLTRGYHQQHPLLFDTTY